VATGTLVLVAALGACGDDASEDPGSPAGTGAARADGADADGRDRTRGADPQPAEGPSSAELRRALLTADDLPAGLEETPAEDDDEEDSDDVFAGTCFEDVGARLEALDEESEADEEAERSFQAAGDELTSVEVGLGYFADPSTFRDQFAEVDRALAECTEITTTTADGVTLDFRLTSTQDAGLRGVEEQLGIVLSGTIGAGELTVPLELRAYLALTGDLGVSFIATTSGEASALADQALPLAQTQVDRAAELR
jgi:hypothetical protein